jgi:hypothetical protein
MTTANTIGLQGMMLATTISYVANKSILWAMLHGMFGWLYIIYYAIQY